MIEIPYIKKSDGRREALQRGEPALTAGELNYQIFYYTKHYYPKNNISESEFLVYRSKIESFVIKFLGETPNYQRYNDMTGALMRCAKEIERRLKLKVYDVLLLDIMRSFDEIIDKYEDTKKKINGDVE